MHVGKFAVQFERPSYWRRASVLCLWLLASIVLSGCAPPLQHVEITGHAPRPSALPKWQVWTQDVTEDQTVSPSRATPFVQAGSEFQLGIALSAAALDSGVRSVAVSENFRKSILAATTEKIRIELVAIPDGRYIDFAPQQRNVATMWVDAKKFRELHAMHGLAVDRALSKTLAEALLDQNNILGSTSFKFEAQTEDGEGHIALSMWVNRRPVDQITVPICIGDVSNACTSARPISSSYGTLGVMSSAPPDASLHFLPLGERAMVGVLFCEFCGDNEQPGYVSWKTLSSEYEFMKTIERQVMPAFTAATDLVSRKPGAGDLTGAYEKAGVLLYKLLFKLSNDPNADVAEAQFRKFLLQARNAQRKPVLLTRFVATDVDRVILPINIVAVKTDDPAATMFVGFEVIVENYSDIDNFEEGERCVRRLTGIVPAANGELKDARTASGPWIRHLAASGDSVKIFSESEFAEFSDWLNRPEREKEPHFLYFFGHHYEDRLCLDRETCDGPSTFYPAAIERSFPAASIAFINGCGSAAVGSTEVLRHLSRLGIGSFIATSTVVDTVMAGKFEAYLFELLLKNADDPSYSISRARYEATIKLSQDVNPSRNAFYGPAALNYTLIGNGKSRVCIQAPVN